jgi:hypothetical protein
MAPFYQPSQPRNSPLPDVALIHGSRRTWQIDKNLSDVPWKIPVWFSPYSRFAAQLIFCMLFFPVKFVFETFLYHAWWWNLTPAFRVGPFFKSPNVQIIIHHVRHVSYVKTVTLRWGYNSSPLTYESTTKLNLQVRLMTPQKHPTQIQFHVSKLRGVGLWRLSSW